LNYVKKKEGLSKKNSKLPLNQTMSLNKLLNNF